jgi:hypothetical protein
MAMVCPQCNTSYEQQVDCPVCHVRLAYKESAPARPGPAARSEEQWQQTPWGRLIGGILLAQGLYLGLVQACLAVQNVTGHVILQETDHSLASLVFRQSLQCVSLLLGGMLAGVGQRRGMLFGALVGLWNTVFFISFQYITGKAELSVVLYAQPILQTAFGTLGGFISCTIWKPPAQLRVPTAPQSPPLLPRPPRVAYRIVALSWGRIAVGLLIALGGTLWANLILQFVLANTVVETTREQDWLVTWEISALAILVGATVAGSNTKLSVRQGMVVGIVTSVVLVGVFLGGMSRRWDPPPMLVLKAMNLRRDLLADPGITAIVTLLFTLGISWAGGWFGGQLLPPLYGPPRRTRRTPHQPALLG